jgi:transcriptional regulator with XRE-family HTH domain
VSGCTISKAFGGALRQLRESKGVSQEWLAERSGLHPTYVGLVERGRRNPTLKASEAMALALSTPLSHLVAKAEEQQRSTRKATGA